MNCPSCGAERTDNESTCSECGCVFEDNEGVDGVKSEGETENNGIKSEGETENDGIKSEGETENDGIKSEGEMENNGIKSEGEMENDGIKSEGETENDKIKSDSEEENNKIKLEAEENKLTEEIADGIAENGSTDESTEVTEDKVAFVNENDDVGNDKTSDIIDGVYSYSIDDDINDIDDYAGYVDDNAQYITKTRSSSRGVGGYIAVIVAIVALSCIALICGRGDDDSEAVVADVTTEATTEATTAVVVTDSVVSGGADMQESLPKVIDNTNYISTYARIIRANYSANESSLYYLFDMNGDSISELIVYYGDTVSGASYDIYTVSGGKIVLCATVDASYSSIYSDGSNIYTMHTNAGTEYLVKLTLAGTAVTEDTVYKGSGLSSYKEIGSYVAGTSTNNLQPLYALS